jgi:hypothetical protein
VSSNAQQFGTVVAGIGVRHTRSRFGSDSSKHETRGKLDDALDDPEGRLPKLMRDHVAEGDFWAVFHAHVIVRT